MAATAAQLANVLPYFPSKDLSTFHVESLLGGGAFSHVVLVRDAGGKEWALKLIPAPGATCLADVDDAPMLLTEARIHLLLSGEPSVLPCMEAFKSAYVDERTSSAVKHATYMAVLRMPVAACTVEEWLFTATPAPQACQGVAPSQIEEREVLSVWLQMVNAVHRCHVHGVIHKDVKLPNFLMDNRGKVQIMDFGLAHVEGVTPRAVAGTPWTMSPAGLKHGDDGRAGDWWALGVVLYQLLQGGAWPFKHCWWPWQKGGTERMEAAIRRAVLAGRITFAGGGRMSEPLKGLIRGLLQSDPNRRWQLRQVLACEAIRPELLEGLAARYPELGPDMEALLQLQRRAREVQALGSDGGGAAAHAAGGSGVPTSLVAAGSVIAAAARTGVQRARGMSAALVGEGGLHWPHLAAGGGGGGSGVSYQPLLNGEDGAGPSQDGAASPSASRSGRSASAPASQAPRNAVAGPAMAPATPATAAAAAGGTARLEEQPGPEPRSSAAAAVADLLLMFPDEVPDAHPSPPVTPGRPVAALPNAPREPWGSGPLLATAGFLEAGDMTTAAASDLPGAAVPASSSAAGPAASGKLPGPALQHASTTNSLSAHARTDDLIRGASDTSSSGPAADLTGQQRATHLHSPGLSGRSLTAGTLPPGSPPHGFSPRGGFAAAGLQSPVSRSRRSRTSLHELFGPNSGSGPQALYGQQSLPGPPPPPPATNRSQRPLSGAGAAATALGGLIGTAVDLLGAVGSHLHGHGHGHGHGRRTGSWTLMQDPEESLLQPLDPGSDGRNSRGSDSGAEPYILPTSSWVPPPPEALATGQGAAALRRLSGGSPTRPSAGGLGAAAGSQTGDGYGEAGPGASHGPVGGANHHQNQHHPSQHHPGGGILARARRLFADCLQRPGVKYDAYDGEDDEYVLPVTRKAG